MKTERYLTISSSHAEYAARVKDMKSLPVLLVFICCLGTTLPACAHPGTAAVLDYLSAKININPGSQSLYRQRGLAYSHDGQYEPALADLQHAATLGDPRVVAFDLGVVYFHTAQYDDAHASFDTYLAFVPGDARALRYRARLLLKTGDLDGAISDHTALLANPEQVTPADYLSVAEMMLQSPRHDVAEAIGVLDQGLNIMGPVPQLQNRAIELELSQGRHDNAISRLRSQAAQLSASPFWQLAMGRLLMDAGQTGVARKHLMEADRQLAKLRKTPARVQLSHELQALLIHGDVTARIE
jgi:tetratricopeptide (TPR) repeat protein